MPTAVCVAVGTPCILCIFVSGLLAVGSLLGLRSVDDIMASPYAVVFLAAGIFNNLMPFRMAGRLQNALRQTEKELATLRVKNLQCFMETDRKFVEGCMLKWYGSIEAFEDTVHNELLTDLKARGVLRKVPCFTYNQACIVYFHSMLMALDQYSFSPAAVMINRFPVTLANSLTLQPLHLAVISAVAHVCYTLHAACAARIHKSFPKAVFWVPGFLVVFIAGMGLQEAIKPCSGWAFTTNLAWNLPVLYLTMKVYQVRFPVIGNGGLLALSLGAIAYLTAIKSDIIAAALFPPPVEPKCIFSFPMGCAPANEATTRCSFRPFDLFGTPCVGHA